MTMIKFALTALLILAGAQALHAQSQTGGAIKEIVQRQIAPDLYFVFDETSSNSAFLITDEGVLVVDTRQHPRDGQDLLNRIRKITDKPIKWVVNTHFHGDHNYGNSVFKAAGAMIISQTETARIMKQVAAKEFKRRQPFFKSRGYDPSEVKLTLPDVTFEKEVTITLGGREIKLVYLGPGQNPGDTFVLFPHDRAIFAPGAFARRSMPNMNFTPSVENWIKLLRQVAKMDVTTVMPPHGDVATPADVNELADFIEKQYALVKDAIAHGVPVDTAVKTLTMPEYKDWHNFKRRDNDIRGLYELIQTGKRSYFE
jgi:glyoxylase-like metal-dependent hydrolase (beta-lactamase superfamily II)